MHCMYSLIHEYYPESEAYLGLKPRDHWKGNKKKGPSEEVSIPVSRKKEIISGGREMDEHRWESGEGREKGKRIRESFQENEWA